MSDLKPVVFLDRDGTMNYDAGYINNVDNFVLYPYTAQAIRMLNINNFLVVVITNQSGLAKGVFTEKTLNDIHDKMVFDLIEKGAEIHGVYICPHDTHGKVEKFVKDCDCRKPKTGLIDLAIKELPIDKNKMYFVGDKYSDIVAGNNAGCKTILVQTGYGKGELSNKKNWEIRPNKVADTLLDAARLIIKNKVLTLKKF